MPAGTAVRLMTMGFEVREQNGPKRVPAFVDRVRRQMCAQYAITSVLNLPDAVGCDHYVPPRCVSSLPKSGTIRQPQNYTPERFKQLTVQELITIANRCVSDALPHRADEENRPFDVRRAGYSSIGKLAEPESTHIFF